MKTIIYNSTPCIVLNRSKWINRSLELFSSGELIQILYKSNKNFIISSTPNKNWEESRFTSWKEIILESEHNKKWNNFSKYFKRWELI